jgi:glycosyltransferase involved in cell wall biosynthesis
VEKNTNAIPDTMPIVTIVTAAYNVENSIEKTIESVRNQSFRPVQWIIIDGGSDDKSIELYKRNTDVISLWVSESDKGIYDAWNKAIGYISGVWVIFLGAGDYFYSKDSLRVAVQKLENLPSDVKFAYGNTMLLSKAWSKVVAGEVDFQAWDLGLPMLPPHPSTFHRTSIFSPTNSFDQSYQIAADSKFMLANKIGRCACYMNIIVTCMPQDGVSSRPAGWPILRSEKQRICRELDIHAPPWYARLQDIKLHLKAAFYLFFGSTISEWLLRTVRGSAKDRSEYQIGSKG